jgi:hypothetical protein
MVFEHPNLTEPDRWRMRVDPDSEARARIFGGLGRTLGPVVSANRSASATKRPRHANDHAFLQVPPQTASTQHEPRHPHFPTNMMEPR